MAPNSTPSWGLVFQHISLSAVSPSQCPLGSEQPSIHIMSSVLRKCSVFWGVDSMGNTTGLHEEFCQGVKED